MRKRLMKAIKKKKKLIKIPAQNAQTHAFGVRDPSSNPLRHQCVPEQDT